MELLLTRSYYKGGTNGVLQSEGKKLCHTIELPWRNNRPCFSCIPEGRYLLEKRSSEKFNDHLQVVAVKGRSLILIHPANDARKQLLGCIAPVMTITGEGTGTDSVLACNLLYRYIVPRIDSERVWLVIRSNTGAVAAPYAPSLLPQLKVAA
jgi:hypothetical protein